MDVAQYFKNLSLELRAVQNRMRGLIGDKHWPSDGAWKESVLRTVLRSHLPKSLNVGSGFILTSAGPSTQIDILIYDDSAPLFFRDGDFVVIPPDSVRAVIEVKTKLTKTGLKTALHKLDSICAILRARCLTNRPFVGLFSFEKSAIPPQSVLELLKQENGKFGNYEISALSFGDDEFYRFWYFDPRTSQTRPHESWHGYRLNGVSQGYFIHNVIDHLYPATVKNSESLWYPIDGKENNLVAEIKRK